MATLACILLVVALCTLMAKTGDGSWSGAAVDHLNRQAETIAAQRAEIAKLKEENAALRTENGNLKLEKAKIRTVNDEVILHLGREPTPRDIAAFEAAVRLLRAPGKRGRRGKSKRPI